MVLEVLILSSWVLFFFFLFLLFFVSSGLIRMTFYFPFFSFYLNSFCFKIRFSQFSIIPYLMVIIISLAVFSWSRYYIFISSSSVLFYMTLFIFVMSILLLLLGENVFMLFLGWEGLGITSFVLIIFYQNWFRFQGGLLTLLTNRVGDGVLILRFGYWIMQGSFLSWSYETRLIISLFLVFLTFTKRAQIPFTSWLPAAIAAPTPVSALVHSSTLVTAGVWLLIKFGNKTILVNRIWLVVGFITLTLARTAAMMEIDSKKLVALSTLSQLGLIFISLFLGGYFICLFHLVIHAFAKANLFLVVGNLIHSRFSLQDIRLIGTGRHRYAYFVIMIIRIFSLRGLFFASGFFSKDFLLIKEFCIFNRIFVFRVFIVIIRMTVVYCIKFLRISLTNVGEVQYSSFRVIRVLPGVVLRFMSVVLGYFYSVNINLLILSKIRGTYWMFLVLAGIFILLFIITNWNVFFSLQQQLIKRAVNFFLKRRKPFRINLSRSLWERSYLVTVFSFFSKILAFYHILILFVLVVLVIIGF